MRRAAFATGTLALAACARSQQRAEPRHAGAPVELTVIGDSLALGTGASDSANGFAFRVFRSIEARRPGSTISNYAIGGSTAADVMRLQAGRLRERRSDCVIVCVGGNDVVRQLDPARFAATYRALLQAVRRGAVHAAIVAVGVPDVSISPLFGDRTSAVRALAERDDRGVRAAARAAGAAYVDLFSLTRSRHDPAAFLSSDRFHPSDMGHEAIARAVTPVVVRALARQ